MNNRNISRIVSESVDSVIKEISSNKLFHASMRAWELFGPLYHKFESFYDALYDYYEGHDTEDLASVADNNRYIQEIRRHADAIKSIIDRKLKQSDSLDKAYAERDAEENRYDGEEEENEGMLNEGIYDYPDGIDHIVFLSENDRECYDIYHAISNALKRKARKGVELSVDILANSSVMKRYQQLCFRKFAQEQMAEGILDRKTAPLQFRRYISERMINDVMWELRMEEERGM